MLTPALHRLALLRAAGVPNAEIARRLGIQVKSVVTRSGEINRRLGVSTRRELAAAIPSCTVGLPGHWNRSRYGFVRGKPVSVTGGPYAGRTGHYVDTDNSRRVRVQIGCAVLYIPVAHVQPVSA